MIGDAKALSDQGPDATQGPAVGLETGGRRPEPQGLQDLLPLRVGQLRPGADSRSVLQGGQLVGGPAQPLGPLADGDAADTQAACDLGMGQRALSEQASAFQAAFFPLSGSQLAGSPHDPAL